MEAWVDWDVIEYSLSRRVSLESLEDRRRDREIVVEVRAKMTVSKG